MRALRLLLVAALALLPLPALAGATALTTLNVRSGPGTAFPVIDVLRPGEGVAVAGCRPGWCFIRSRHGEGWASAGYLAGLVDHPVDAVVVVHPADVVVVDRVVVVERRRHKPVARWPEPWNEPTYPPRRLPSPYPYPVAWPERFW
ncbi:MAG TPA: SH3 domain-containing protein [Devosia sp.]